MTRLYISGPVTGIKDDNRLAFSWAQNRLMDAGYEAFTPHKIVDPDDTHETAMLLCVNELTERTQKPGISYPVPRYDGLALLPGWEQSDGARLERAEACGIPCKTVEEWIEDARVRKMRSECHKLFDRTWKTRDERKDCYVRLSRKLGITLGECHFSTMSAELLERSLEILREVAR